jgi:hypothetical protein
VLTALVLVALQPEESDNGISAIILPDLYSFPVVRSRSVDSLEGDDELFLFICLEVTVALWGILPRPPA